MEATNIGPASFLRMSNKIVPNKEPHTAKANALVAQVGMVEYMACCSTGNAAMSSGVIVTCMMYMATPTIFQSSASTAMIQNEVVGFVVGEVMGWGFG